MNRLAESLLACLLPSIVASAAPEDPPAAPNVLLILADDMGYADARCYGGEIDTPAIDRLAAEGLRFTHFAIFPENGKFAQPGIDRFEMTFADTLDFSRSAGKRIRLHAVSDEEIPVIRRQSA